MIFSVSNVTRRHISLFHCNTHHSPLSNCTGIFDSGLEFSMSFPATVPYDTHGVPGLT